MKKVKMNVSRLVTCFVVLGALLFLSACGPKAPPPIGSIVTPTPILDNSGEYMCPFTQDEVMAEWTDNAVNAKMGSAIGGTLGAYAGAKALEQIPFVGGFIGNKVGKSIGRKIAVESAGGEEFIRETSDISFNNLDDMAVYMYIKFSHLQHFPEALDAAMEIYPDLKEGGYMAALHKAPKS